ncbi:MAG: hypothetical protein KY469_11895 [Actinobacteria bacterium]|nr:hypothetical protein [Actinomycetota bacterium]
MARSGPPAYAWDWFSRQRLLWDAVRQRLAHHTHPASPRYRSAQTKSDVVTLLRADYGRDDDVRAVVDRTVSELVFLDRTDVPFDRLGHRNPPRGLRWWWTALTGEEVERDAPVVSQPTQLTLDEVHEGYGG